MKKIIFIILLACCQVTAFAQQAAKTFTVSGTVVDETDTPVPGASVYAKDRPVWEPPRMSTESSR